MLTRFRLKPPSVGWRRVLVRGLAILMIVELTAPQTIALSAPSESDVLSAAAWRLGLLVPGGVIADTAAMLNDPRFTPLVLMKLDSDGSGLTFDEVLGADLLGIAREVRTELGIGTPGKNNKNKKDPRVGGDRALAIFLDDARGRVAQALDLGLPFEELPSVKLNQQQMPKGAEIKFLRNLPPGTLEPSLEYLRQFLNELNLETDFVGRNAALNLERRRVLTENAGHMLTALGAGATDVVAEQLLMMRSHVAGGSKGNQGDESIVWIRGRRAVRILDQIDVGLAMLGIGDPANL